MNRLNETSSIVFPPPPHRPYDISYENWSIKWWEWLTSIPKNINPAFDTEGHNSFINQSQMNVWFLAGTFGGYVERKCTIKFGKALFFPIINIEASFSDTNVSTENDLISYTEQHIDDIDKNRLEVFVDDLRIDNLHEYRVRSPVFDLYLDENNVIDVKPGPTKATSDGYWLLLRPLSRGSHTISFSGSCLAGRIRIGAKYVINIE